MWGLIVVSLVISLGIIWAVGRLARSQYWGKAGVCVFSLVAGILLCFFPVVTLQLAITFVLTLACAALRLSPKGVARAAWGAMIVSYGVVLAMSISELRELARLRERYPLQSISARLTYEVAPAKVSTPDDGAPDAVDLGSEVEERLAKFEGGFAGISGDIRQYMLNSLHDRTRDQFVLARGFGPVRMLSVRGERIELPDPGPISIPPEPEPVYEPGQDPSVPLAGAGAPRPPQSALLSMHDGGLEDFFDPERMGYVRDREHVAGFLAHRFTRNPEPGPREQQLNSWNIVRLELVSLLKHEVPMAYVSKNLPRMEELRDAPTRPLDGFERDAVERLRSDEDLVIGEDPDNIRMVGSLRAARNCLECHSVRRGELLGALTYELVPARTTRPMRRSIGPPSS